MSRDTIELIAAGLWIVVALLVGLVTRRVGASQRLSSHVFAFTLSSPLAAYASFSTGSPGVLSFLYFLVLATGSGAGFVECVRRSDIKRGRRDRWE